MSFKKNMITFEGNRQNLKYAKLLEAKARNIYPHISTSKFQSRIGESIAVPKFLSQVSREISVTRKVMKNSFDYYSSLIFGLMEKKRGNCTEEAIFTQLLGLINGQKNIYAGGICLKRDNQKVGLLNHAIAFITDKPVKNGKDYSFKNKDAIIIDPWLGVTDFAGNYFAKLKTIYRKYFMYDKSKKFATFSNDNLAMELLREESKTPKEFKQRRKEECPITEMQLIPFIDNENANKYEINNLKEFFPELVIKNYKRIGIPNKKTKFIRMNIEY